MCEFTESILPLLLKSYDQNSDYKKKVQYKNNINVAWDSLVFSVYLEIQIKMKK